MAERKSLAPVIEALIFAASGPLTLVQLRRSLPALKGGQLQASIKQINEELARDGRPYEICEVAGGYQFRTRPEFAAAIRALQPERKLRLSRPALETLAVIAYRQPITRAEIEDLRCVDSGAVLRSLLDRNLVRIVGRRDAPGRPVLYGTSSNFLETFGLGGLTDLPELRELDALEEEQGTLIGEPSDDDAVATLEPSDP